MRLFAALELPDALKDELAVIRGAVCGVDRRWCDQKWVAPENLHITVGFFGEVPEGDVDRVIGEVGDAAAGLCAPRLSAARVVATPPARKARMLWVEWQQDNDSAASLAHELARRLPEYVDASDRRFRAHATLCRARTPRPVEPSALEAANALLETADATMSVPVVSVVSSRLTPRGPVYATIGTRHFGGE